MQRNVKLCSKSSPRNAKEKQIKLNVQKYDCHNLFFLLKLIELKFFLYRYEKKNFDLVNF